MAWVWGARGPTASQMATPVKPPAPSGNLSLQVQNTANLKREREEFTPTYLPQLAQPCTRTAKEAQVDTSNRTTV